MNKFNQKGVTLIELLVTLLILTIGIAALIKFQMTYFYYYDLSKQRAEAIFLAKAKMDALRAFETIPTTSGKFAYNDIVSGSSTSTGNNATYSINWTVTTYTNPNYKTVNITVSWTDRRNAAKSISLSSIIAQLDPSTSGVVMNA
jgi:type IV pilus modification protein PilV